MRGEYLGRMVTCFPGLAKTGMNAIDTEKSPDALNGGSKAAKGSDQAAAKSSGSALPGLAMFASVLALAVSGWVGWQLLALQDVPSRISGDAGKIQDIDLIEVDLNKLNLFMVKCEDRQFLGRAVMECCIRYGLYEIVPGHRFPFVGLDPTVQGEGIGIFEDPDSELSLPQ